MKPIARLGYMDYSVVDDFFTIKRPEKPARRAALAAQAATLTSQH